MTTIASLSIYPVKSMKGVSVQSAEVDLIGLAGDRRWMVVDENGKFQTIRQHFELSQIEAFEVDDMLRVAHPSRGTIIVGVPGASAPTSIVTIWRSEVEARHASDESSTFLSDIFGRKVRLVYLENVAGRAVNPKYSTPGDHVSFADGYPILLASEASLQDLEVRVGFDLDMRRFRPNIVVTGVEPWVEDTWRRIQIGAVQFRVARPCGRCVVTTLDPDTGATAPANEPLATLGKMHRASDGEIIFGQNLISDGPGRISVGDELAVLESGPSNLL